MTIFEITDNMKSLKELIDQVQDEPVFETEEERAEWITNRDMQIDALHDTMEALEGSFDDKIDGITNLYKSVLAEVDALKGEEKKLAKRRKVKERIAERLKSYLDYAMNTTGKSKFENERHRISFSKSQSVQIHDEESFIFWASENATDLLKVKPEIRKSEVKKILKEDPESEVSEYAEIVTNKNIQIK